MGEKKTSIFFLCMRFYIDWNNLYNKNGLSDAKGFEFGEIGDNFLQ